MDANFLGGAADKIACRLIRLTPRLQLVLDDYQLRAFDLYFVLVSTSTILAHVHQELYIKRPRCGEDLIITIMTFTIPETTSSFTSGQHEPVPELIAPYSAFPKEIIGPTVWKREDFINDTSRWQHRWTPELIDQLEESYKAFSARGVELPEINKVSSMSTIQRYQLTVIDYIPAQPFGSHLLRRSARTGHSWVWLYLDTGSPSRALVNTPECSDIPSYRIDLWGHTESKWERTYSWACQSEFAILLHDRARELIMQDIGNDPTQIDKVRIYSTAARQFFHTDAADIVGLLCLAKAQEGGESEFSPVTGANVIGDVVSAHQVWNTLQAERPDVAELLAQPEWYFDRKGEVSKGQNGWVKKAVRDSRVDITVNIADTTAILLP
jgi:hypothetical protein